MPENSEWNKLVNWRDAFRDTEKNVGECGIPQQATFEILKNCCARLSRSHRRPLRCKRALCHGEGESLPSGAGPVPCARAALFHRSGCRGSPSAPWTSELSCGGDSSTADRATSSRWMQTPLGLLCAEANVSYGSVAQRREAE